MPTATLQALTSGADVLRDPDSGTEFRVGVAVEVSEELAARLADSGYSFEFEQAPARTRPRKAPATRKQTRKTDGGGTADTPNARAVKGAQPEDSPQ